MGFESGMFRKQNQPGQQAGASGTASFAVQEVYEIRGVGIVVAGRVESGMLAPGMKASINQKPAQIISMEIEHTPVASAKAGDMVGINIHGIEKSDVQGGMTLNFK